MIDIRRESGFSIFKTEKTRENPIDVREPVPLSSGNDAKRCAETLQGGGANL